MSKRITRFTIDVTADDIANGERENGLRCPIARAINRTSALTHMAKVLPSEHGIGYIAFGTSWTPLPPHVNQWALDFDSIDRDVQPFTFELDL